MCGGSLTAHPTRLCGSACAGPPPSLEVCRRPFGRRVSLLSRARVWLEDVSPTTAMQDEPLKIPWPSFEGVRVPRTVEQVSGVAPKSRVQSVSHQTDTVSVSQSVVKQIGAARFWHATCEPSVLHYACGVKQRWSVQGPGLTALSRQSPTQIRSHPLLCYWILTLLHRHARRFLACGHSAIEIVLTDRLGWCLELIAVQ
jgi:hypothetical protein